MFSFKTVINSYINIFKELELKDYEYDTIEGDLRFVKIDNEKIILNSIFVKSEFRNRVIFSKFLKFIVDNDIGGKQNNFWICDVISKVLYSILSNFQYKGYKFKITNFGFHLIGK